MTEFLKIINDLKNIEVKIYDKDNAPLLLNSLYISFENFKDVLLYDKKDTITLDEVRKVVRSKNFFEGERFEDW